MYLALQDHEKEVENEKEHLNEVIVRMWDEIGGLDLPAFHSLPITFHELLDRIDYFIDMKPPSEV